MIHPPRINTAHKGTDPHDRALRALIALGVATIIAVVEQPGGWGAAVIVAMWFAYGIVEMVTIYKVRGSSVRDGN